MVDNKKNENEDEFYEEISEVADFVHDRLDDFVDPTAFNNSVEEYVEDDKKEQ